MYWKTNFPFTETSKWKAFYSACILLKNRPGLQNLAKILLLLKITLQAWKEIHYLGHKAWSWSFSAYALDSLAV